METLKTLCLKAMAFSKSPMGADTRAVLEVGRCKVRECGSPSRVINILGNGSKGKQREEECWFQQTAGNMKENSSSLSSTAMGYRHLLMGISSRGITREILRMGMGSTIGRTETSLKECSKMVSNTGRVNGLHPMGMFTKGIMRMIRSVETERWDGGMETSTLGSFLTICVTGRVKWGALTEYIIGGHGRKECLMVKVHLRST